MTAPVHVRPAEPEDAAHWERMREVLWPSAEGEHAREIAAFFAGERGGVAEVLLAVDEDGSVIGFAELGLRSYAEGCDSGRVGYLEGWFVEETARNRGVGAALIAAGEEWARSHGCTEFASDTDIENEAATAAHLALGFTEVQRMICFRKPL